MDVERLSTNPFLLDRYSTAWGNALRSAGLGVEPQAEVPWGRLARRATSQGTDIVVIAAGPQRLTRHPMPGGDERIWLGMLLEGEARLPDGETARDRELLIWSASPGPLCVAESRFRMVLLNLSRFDQRWGPLPETIGSARHQVIRRGSHKVLAGLLATMADAAEEGGEGSLTALELALHEILPSALGMLGGSSARAALRRRILRAIEMRLGDPRLNLTRLAAVEGVSARAVQKFLDEDSQTFSQYLRHRRLERAAEILADPHQSEVPVGEIAFRCGFSDPAHFSRAFRQHHGMTPSTYRIEARTPSKGIAAAF
jgi:AraC-like DNA-binding protein